jgi:hypothetical protein
MNARGYALGEYQLLADADTMQFYSPTGVRGTAVERGRDGEELWLMGAQSTEFGTEGERQFLRFLQRCQKVYQTVITGYMHNAASTTIAESLGFRVVSEVFPGGQIRSAYRWDRPQPK